MKRKLLVVVSHPIQYHAPIWREFASSALVDAEICFCSQQGLKAYHDKDFGIHIHWDIPLTQGYSSKFYRNLPIRFLGQFGKYFNPSLLSRIAFGKYNAIYLHGFGHATHLLAICLASFRGKKIIVRNISYQFGNASLFKKFTLSILLKLPDYFLYIGQRNKEYYLYYGVPDHKLYYAPHIVDNTFFQQQRSQLKGLEVSIKNDWGIPSNAKIVLFCGKLFSKKQPDLLLRAFSNANFNDVWHLLIVGDGVMKNSLMQEANDRVTFIGFLNQTEIAKAYLVSEVIVLPSAFGETWGLVINEAFNFNCAAIVSDRVGCAADLVEGKAGEVFEYMDERMLQQKLEMVLNDSALLGKYQRQAGELIVNFTASKIREQVEKIAYD